MSIRPGPLDEPPAKRQRLQTDIPRSPDFWFKEGRFVLVASQKVAFRLHGDVLGRKSKVFNDLLNLDDVPRPDLEDTIDGCPVVHIKDSPEDFSMFLSLVYDGFEYHRQHAQKPHWATVRIMIVLGDKYDAPEMREEGLKQLRGWYAEDLDEWDKRDEEFFAHETDHLSVASITRTLGERNLHAAVLYHCCRLPGICLILGEKSTNCPPLCANDLVRAFDYSAGMAQDYLDISRKLSNQLCKELSDCSVCSGVWREVQVTIGKLTTLNAAYNGFRVLDSSAWTDLSEAVEATVCKNCGLHYKSRIRLLRQEYQEKLVERVY